MAAPRQRQFRKRALDRDDLGTEALEGYFGASARQFSESVSSQIGDRAFRHQASFD
jgi:hypothetical protein